MRSTLPTMICDGTDEHACNEWETDYFAMNVSTVNGTRITATTRAPGWYSAGNSDLCHEHAPADERNQP